MALAQEQAAATHTVTMTLDLQGSGWGSFRLRVGDVADEVRGVSYLSDPLAAVLQAGVSVALRRIGDFVLHQEPGAQRYTVFFDAQGAGGCWRITRYAHREDVDELDLPPPDGAPAFSAVIAGPDAFAAAALALGERVAAELGEEGYEALWDRDRLPFPRRALAALRAALAVVDRLSSGSR